MASFELIVFWFTDVVRCRRGFGERICEPDELERFDFAGTVVGDAGQHSTIASPEFGISHSIIPVAVNGSSIDSFCSVESLSDEAELGAFWIISDIFEIV